MSTFQRWGTNGTDNIISGESKISVVEGLRRVRRQFQGTLIIAFRFAPALERIENGAFQKQRPQVARMGLQKGVQLLIRFRGSAMLESRGGLIQHGRRRRLLAQKHPNPQRRDNHISGPIHTGHNQFSIMPLRWKAG
jgi:hypothetical protein